MVSFGCEENLEHLLRLGNTMVLVLSNVLLLADLEWVSNGGGKESKFKLRILSSS